MNPDEDETIERPEWSVMAVTEPDEWAIDLPEDDAVLEKLLLQKK